MIQKALQPIDNAPLILFRILFGFLFACESFGAIATGWVTDNFVNVHFTFNHIYMDFLQVLVGPQMYLYFFLMGCVSLGVMLGWRYRINIVLLTILWAGVYFAQKTSYNNHYYLMLIISFYMCFLPANGTKSLDVKSGRVKESLLMPRYISWIFIFQVSVVYLFGTLAKFYPDWLDGTFTRQLYSNVQGPDFLKAIFSEPWFYMSIAYLGILFDGLIVPLLLWKRTRMLAVVASLIFHLFNSVTLHIGVFPYLALSFSIFFFPPAQIRAFFFPKSTPPQIDATTRIANPLNKIQMIVLGVFVVFQVLLPIRSYFIPGDILWTDEGHRLSWRMMLRGKGGYTNFYVVDKQTGQRVKYDTEAVLSPKQRARLTGSDVIWQMAQYIKKDYAKQGKEVEVYVDSFISINGRPLYRYIDPEVDLAKASWNYFYHDDWVLDKPF